MKKILFYAGIAFLTGMAFASCSPAEDEFNEQFLYAGSGKWHSVEQISGEDYDWYYVFQSDKMGKEWSVSDDVGESEARFFQWSLSGPEYRKLICTEMSGGSCGVPKYYTVMELTATRFRYKDSFGKTVTCTKVD